MTEQFEIVDLEGPTRLHSIAGIVNGVSEIGDNTPARISLIDLGFHDMREGGDGTHVTLSIVWDRDRRVFDFQGDTELCTPAARQFFEEFGACAMDWLKDHLR